MSALLLIVTNTPWWVFLLFALLVWLGVQALRPRTVALRRVFITPAVFIAWGAVGLALAARTAPAIVPAWGLAAAAGCALALVSVRLEGLSADRSRATVHLPGSRLPLIRNMLIFAAKYGLAVAMARRPELRDQLLPWDMAVSGASFGYFLGWTARFVLSYRRAAAAPVVAPSGSQPASAPASRRL
ncbi:MAG: DUF6622 family protein [Stellaceae bacterium]